MQAARHWARGELTTDSDDTPDDDTTNAPAGDTTDEALAAFGLAPVRDVAPERAVGDVFHLWPELVPVFNLFCELRTQWREAWRGKTGLDYAGVESHLRLAGTPRRDWPALFADLRTMERSALDAWAERRARDEARRGR